MKSLFLSRWTRKRGGRRFHSALPSFSTPPLLTSILTVCFAQAVQAVTLQKVLQTTLEKNPAIQEAKAGLEQATGKRLVFHSLVWPHAEVGVPAGVQAGHRSGESGVKGFAVGRGALEQVLFNMAVPPSLRRGDGGTAMLNKTCS